MTPIIRDLKRDDILTCEKLVYENWGADARDRAREQMFDMFRFGPHSPQFFAATMDGKLIGFAGYRASWVMRDAYEFIWVAVDKRWQGFGVGRMLVDARMAAIKRRGGTLVSLVTQKPEFFWRFGFSTTFRLDNDWMFMQQRIGEVRI